MSLSKEMKASLDHWLTTPPEDDMEVYYDLEVQYDADEGFSIEFGDPDLDTILSEAEEYIVGDNCNAWRITCRPAVPMRGEI